MNRAGGRAAIAWSLAPAIAVAAPGHAQDGGSRTADLPDIKWSLSGEASVRSPARRSEKAPAKSASAATRKIAAKAPTAKKSSPLQAAVAQKTAAAKPKPKPKPASTEKRAPPPRPVAKPTPATRPVAAQVQAPVAKAVVARPPAPAIVAPAPVAAPPQPRMPAPRLAEDSGPAGVTIHPLAPRQAPEDNGSFGEAVAATANHTGGFAPLRSAVGILSLAAALLALIALWWQSVGARSWGRYRRKAQPRLMIDIPLAAQPALGEVPMPETALDREEA